MEFSEEIGFDQSTFMVQIPNGVVEMRDDRIKKQWNVDIQSFGISKYPVTQAFYSAILKNNPSSFLGDNRPVETVTWVDAVNFCNELSKVLNLDLYYNFEEEGDRVSCNPEANGYRLPTEAEWQYACQEGKHQIRYGELSEIAWFKDNSNGTVHDVGQKTPNKWGLYDMLGNVWEWCSDIYDESIYGSYRVFRGGGWCDVDRSVMATTRRRSHPTSFKIDDLGFRIARN